ncbi:hypothetical protein ACTJJ4_07510 [Microbacterium sp. 22195]|uniref:hypothetical protein n=1 Tax=Microbacterium sp. 22195 TaxID=3453891 RepID=UPI003F85158D
MATGLPWVRMDSDIYANPKVATFIDEHGQRGLAAMAVWHFAIEYSGAHATDGVIAKSALRFIHATAATARLLVEGGFFEPHEKGWAVTGYANHQPTKEITEALRQQLSEAGKKGAAARWGGKETS